MSTNPHPRADPHPPDGEQTDNGSRVTVLLVEDNPGDARLVVESFRDAPLGFKLTHVVTLAEAEAQILQSTPDLVLLDLSLPDSHGLPTVAAVRAAAPTAAIVVLTGTDDRELSIAALTEGAQDYLVKGMHNGEFLERAVRFALSRKALVAELEETTAELAAILDGSPIPMLVVDGDGIVRKANRAAGEFSGRHTADELLGLRGGEALGCLEAFSAPGGCWTGQNCDTCPIRDAVNRTLESCERIDKGPIVKTLRRGSETAEHNLEVSTAPVETARGRMAVVSVEDVTERTTAVQAVRRSEQSYRHLFENNLAGVYQSTFDGRLLRCNRALRAMLGIDDDSQWDSMDVVQLWGNRDQRKAFVERIAATGRVGNVEVEIKKPDGSAGWLLVNANLSPGSHDGRRIIEGTAIDITTRKLAEAQVRDQLAFLETLLDAIPNPVFYKGADGRYRGCNRAFEAFIGTTSDDLVGKTSADIAPAHLAAEYTANDQALFERSGSQVYESKVVTANGSVREVEFSKATYTDLDDNVTGLVGVITDLTDRREIEEALHHAQKIEALGQLAGGVAHDFNNLLQAMMLLVEELGNPDLADGDREEMRGEIQRLVHRASQLTRQLLLFSRREKARTEVLDLNEVLRSSEDLIRRLLREDIRIDIQTEDRPVRVSADAGQLEQVIVNLAVNAQDAMAAGGRLEFKVSVEDRFARLDVADTGHGMPQRVLDRIFDPFFTTKEPGKGTGLGLSVAHGIISANGGNIEVTSDEGSGTTFTISLPLTEGDVAASSSRVSLQPAPFEPSRANPTGTVLVVDDEPSVLRVLQRTLRHIGFEVLAAGDIATAIGTLDGTRLSLLVTDMMLPDGTGLDLITRIRETWADLPAVLISGYSDQDSAIHEASENGSIEFLQKPFSMADITSTVTRALSARKSERAE